MKQLKAKMLASTLAAAFVLGGPFAGTAHNAYAADVTTGQSGSAATTSAAASEETIDGVAIPAFAKLHGVDLRLGKAALSTAIILNEDLQDVYDALSSGQTLSSIGSQGVPNYSSQLLAMTQSNIDAAVSGGNIDTAQSTQLSGYASRILNQEMSDANYRDSDNSSGDSVVSTLLSVDADNANIAKFLGMSQDDLTTELESGKSLGAIAQEKGIGAAKLAAKLEDGSEADLQKIVWNTPPAAATITIVNPADDTTSQ